MKECNVNTTKFELNHENTDRFLLTVFGEYESVRGTRNFATTMSVSGDEPLSSIYEHAPRDAKNIRHSLWDNREEFLAFARRQNDVRNIDQLYVLNKDMHIIYQSWNGSQLANVYSKKQDDDIIVLVEFPSNITVL